MVHGAAECPVDTGVVMAQPGRQGRPKRKRRIKEAVVLVPLTYNDGTAVPRKVLKSIREELFVAFHGWTVEGTVKGAYRMRGGQKQVEDLQKLSIILDESRIPELETMVGRWGATLGQEAMLMKIADLRSEEHTSELQS